PAPESYTLSLHDALPILETERQVGVGLGQQRRGAVDGVERGPVLPRLQRLAGDERGQLGDRLGLPDGDGPLAIEAGGLEVGGPRSEEHTSELQSRENLVC